ncbi:MAG: DUF5752 family protein [Desulfobacca sp.]|nr:DUF5752 family protein [Desulfobacca sp.]
MTVAPEQTAQDPFWFRECFVMPMPIGRKATNLRELVETLRVVDEWVPYYHLFQYRLSLTYPGVEYPNEFAFWAANALQDNQLAEKLSSFDPFDFQNMVQVREALIDILDSYMWDLTYIPWARPGFEFDFCEASTAIIRSQIVAHTLPEFCQALQQVGLDSIYYHFFEARWRLGLREVDDFSFWIEYNFDCPEAVKQIRDIDLYFYSLREIRTELLKIIDQHLGDHCDQAG